VVGASGRIWVDLHRSAATKALYANPPDWPEMVVWQQRTTPGSLFIDVGANVGTYTVLAASLGAEVIAVEPAPDTAALLAENITLNGFDTVQVVKAAAGRAVGTTRFSQALDTVNHLDPLGPVDVEVVTVDSLVGDRQVAGLKVDVEGFELDVLEGARHALATQRIHLIQLEWNDASREATGVDRRPAAALLRDYGYHLLRPDSCGRLQPDPDPEGIADVFAAPSGSTHHP